LILNEKINCLDKGYLEYVDHMGSDLSVVNAARVSFDKRSTELSAGDIRLIDYLAKHHHWSPFAHAVLNVRIRAPISVQRQWEKHSVGVNNNSESTRYVKIEPEFYIPDRLRLQSKDKKQGSEGFMDVTGNEAWKERVEHSYKQAHTLYSFLLRNGVATEQARDVLPLATYTTWISTMSLYAAWRIYKQRTKDGAQYEISVYAESLGSICSQLFPKSWEALRTHDYA